MRDKLSTYSQYDLAIVGSGFAGSLLAMIARRLGRSVILLERGRHPRVVIGESSTPLSNLLLEELATRYNLPEVKQLTKWGVWQDTHLELACGLKRGFSFFHHSLGEKKSRMNRENQLLVAASPHDQISDTHWYRADFDQFLMQQARSMGSEYLDELHLQGCVNSGDGMHLRGVRQGHEVEIKASFVVDASGPRGFLHQALGLGERELPGFPATQALYSHFSGVKRLDALYEDDRWKYAPYPIDDAAVHHIFDGGWVWALHFNNGVTSAGVVAVTGLAEELQLREGREAWERLLARIPVLRDQFAESKSVQPFRYLAQVGFRSAVIAKDNWALLPSAAGLVDPLLSTGFPLALLGIERLAEIFDHNWGTRDLSARLESYAAQTDNELVATSRLIGALYATMDNFPVFTAISRLYFAAASYSEAARRLRKPHLASSFLLHDHPQFGPACRAVLDQAHEIRPGKESEDLTNEIFRVIEPFDVAGLSRQDRGNWYPIEAEDLLKSAHKVGATEREIMAMLERCGFRPATSQPYMQS
ncbi:MAG: NAD(P)/FAD-dependent oxidoreductase [Acidobacteriaceae bacterium]